MPFFNNNNAEIYYDVQGKGPEVLLIAGLASDSQSWQFILKAMIKNFTVITFDNRGTGRTKIKDYRFSIRDMAYDSMALLKHLNIDQCMVIGHSMGGCIAQDLAYLAPEKIRKMVLASTTMKMSDRNKSLFDHFIAEWQSNIPQEQWLRNLFYWLFSPNAFTNKKFLDAAIIYTMCYPYQQTFDSFKSQIEALVNFDSTEYIKEIAPETLVITGAKDILVYPDESEKLKKLSGFSDYKIIKNAGHSIHAEYPEEFVDTITPFLK